MTTKTDDIVPLPDPERRKLAAFDFLSTWRPTLEDLDAIEAALGMGAGAWDMVDRADLVVAAVRRGLAALLASPPNCGASAGPGRGACPSPATHYAVVPRVGGRRGVSLMARCDAHRIERHPARPIDPAAP